MSATEESPSPRPAVRARARDTRSKGPGGAARETVAIAVGVELLYVPELDAGLLAHPPPHAEVERAVTRGVERSRWQPLFGRRRQHQDPRRLVSDRDDHGRQFDVDRRVVLRAFNHVDDGTLRNTISTSDRWYQKQLFDRLIKIDHTVYRKNRSIRKGSAMLEMLPTYEQRKADTEYPRVPPVDPPSCPPCGPPSRCPLPGFLPCKGHQRRDSVVTASRLRERGW